MIKKTKIWVILSLLTAACGVVFPGNRVWLKNHWSSRNNFSSNGASIYYAGTTQDGEVIDYSGGPFAGMMMNQGIACASCHGDDGSGGRHVMHMDVMDAPDIRLTALEAEFQKHAAGGENYAEPHGEKYDLHTFERAVVFGEHPDGEPLSDKMPRWQLSDQDLEDLYSFLDTLE